MHFELHTQGLKFDVIPSTFEETLDKSAFKHPYEYVLENSKQKALEVAGRIDKVSACYVKKCQFKWKRRLNCRIPRICLFDLF